MPLEKLGAFDSYDLSIEQRSLLTTVIKTLPVVSEEGVLNSISAIEHSIYTGETKPVYSKPYIFSPKLQSKIRDEIYRATSRAIRTY